MADLTNPVHWLKVSANDTNSTWASYENPLELQIRLNQAESPKWPGCPQPTSGRTVTTVTWKTARRQRVGVTSEA